MFEKGDKNSSASEELFTEIQRAQQPEKIHDNKFKRSFLNNFYFPFRKGHLTFSVRPALQKELAFAKEKFAMYVQEKMEEPDIQEGDFEIASPLNLAIAVPLPIKRSSTFAISGNVGIPVFGIDMTMRTFDNTFLTANFSYLSGEIIAQQRLYNGRDVGIALGVNYRLQRRWLRVIEGPDESFGLSTIWSLLNPARVFYNHTVGLRSVFYFPFSENTNLHVVAAPGYVTNVKELTLNMGISLKYQLW